MRTCAWSYAAALFLGVFSAPAVHGATTWYVDDDASAGGNGVTWTTAYKYLQDALAAAQVGDEIHVGAGTYTPDRDEAGNVIPGDRIATFRLVSGVELVGGYAGLANAGDPDERDIEAYQSILSGDLAHNDVADLGGFLSCFSGDGVPYEPDCDLFDLDGDGDVDAADGRTDENAYSVVTGSWANESAILDGFTITAGNTTGYGGGMLIYEGSPTITNCTFRANAARIAGGGMYNSQSNTTVTNCTFTANLTHGDGVSYNFGGGMYNGDSSPTILDCTFSGNSADGGGGMVTGGGAASLTNCIFILNTARYGGGLYNSESDDTRLTNCRFLGNSADSGGGIDHSAHSIGILTLDNCTFSGNSATYGGGGLNVSLAEAGNRLTLTNCTLSGNWAGSAGGGISYAWGRTTLTNCILWGNSDSSGTSESAQVASGSPDVSYSCIQGWTGVLGGVGNIGDDPLFVDPRGPDGVVGTVDDNLRLMPGSPGIDTGDPAYDSGPGATDLDGNPRVLDGDFDGTAIVDRGAYESDPEPYLARKNRYISFASDNSGTAVAFQVEMTAGPGATGVLGWVGETDENDVARVVADPFFTDAWPEVVHVGDCEIVPVAAYEIRTTLDGMTFFDPLEVGTILQPGARYYGDVVGTGTGHLPPRAGFTPPNGVVNVSDVQAYQLTVQGQSTPSVHTTWVDLHGLGDGSPPDFVVNVSDLQRILFGFWGQRYGDAPDHMNPADCP